ncbi:MAG TPA: hypothetical protein VJR29_08260 [bacterium]|nr:hypothetical protein [bacterium]
MIPGEMKARKILLLAMGLLTILKLALVWSEEITARFMPADQSWYLNAAQEIAHGNWLGSRSLEAMFRPPGYPLWIYLSGWIPLPARLSIEIFFLGAAGCLVLALLSAGLRPWAAAFLFAALAFLPDSFRIHNELWAEALLGPLLLLGLGAMIFSWTAKSYVGRLGLTALSAAAFAWLLISRHEGLWVWSIIGIFLAINGFRAATGKGPKLDRAGREALVAAVAVGLPLLAGQAVAWRNAEHYGVRAPSELLSPHYREAMDVLTRIQVDEYEFRVPVNREARRKAYLASPTFHQLESYLEGSVGRGWVNIGCLSAKVCEDYAGGWFMMAFREAVEANLDPKSIRDRDEFYHRIASELGQACREGKLPCHPPKMFSTSGYANPFAPLPWGELARSGWRVLKLHFRSHGLSANQDNPTWVKPELSQAYDRWLQRNPLHVQKGKLQARGSYRAFAGDSVKAVALVDRPSEVSLARQEAGGLEGKFQLLPSVDLGKFPWVQPSDFVEPALRLELASGRAMDFEARPGKQENGGVEIVVESLEGLREYPAWKGRLLRVWGAWYYPLLTAGILAAMAAGLGPSAKRPRLGREFWAAIALIGGALALRLLLLAYLDFASFSIDPYFRLTYASQILGLSLGVPVAASLGRRNASSAA